MQYQVRGGDRLYNLAQQFYGEVSDAGVQSIAYANPTVWDGNSHLEPGVMLDIPERIEPPEFNTQDSYSDVDALRLQADVHGDPQPLDPT